MKPDYFSNAFWVIWDHLLEFAGCHPDCPHRAECIIDNPKCPEGKWVKNRLTEGL